MSQYPGTVLIRKIGRAFRRYDSGILRAIESLLMRNCPDKDIEMPLLAVCGTSRSGHTLTHQVISQGVQVFVVNNLQCLFYRTPLVGYLLSKLICRPYVSDYKSTGGYIPGLNGPHEGAWMWVYWCDMGLKERPPQPHPDRLREFRRLMNKLYALDGRPYCDSWVGHALYFEHLQNLFRHCIIICARRDLLSTALSIVNFTRNQGGEYRLNWSVQPRECQDPAVLSRLSTYERIAWQVYFINRRMDEQAATGRYAVFHSLYSDLCENPQGFISRLTTFAKAQGVVLAPRTDTELPVGFPASKAHRDQNEHTKQLASAFDVLLDQFGPVGVPLELA
jgi:hypothetical protein